MSPKKASTKKKATRKKSSAKPTATSNSNRTVKLSPVAKEVDASKLTPEQARARVGRIYDLERTFEKKEAAWKAAKANTAKLKKSRDEAHAALLEEIHEQKSGQSALEFDAPDKPAPKRKAPAKPEPAPAPTVTPGMPPLPPDPPAGAKGPRGVVN